MRVRDIFGPHGLVYAAAEPPTTLSEEMKTEQWQRLLDVFKTERRVRLQDRVFVLKTEPRKFAGAKWQINISLDSNVERSVNACLDYGYYKDQGLGLGLTYCSRMGKAPSYNFGGFPTRTLGTALATPKAFVAAVIQRVDAITNHKFAFQPEAVTAAAEPQAGLGHSERRVSALQWLKFAAELHKAFPERFTFTKGSDGSAEINDVQDMIEIRRMLDGVTLFANGKATICVGLTLTYKTPGLLGKALAFVRLQEAADRMVRDGAAAMRGPFAEIQALLPEVKAPGSKVQQAVEAFRRRINKGFTESGRYMADPVL